MEHLTLTITRDMLDDLVPALRAQERRIIEEAAHIFGQINGEPETEIEGLRREWTDEDGNATDLERLIANQRTLMSGDNLEKYYVRFVRIDAIRQSLAPFDGVAPFNHPPSRDYFVGLVEAVVERGDRERVPPGRDGNVIAGRIWAAGGDRSAVDADGFRRMVASAWGANRSDGGSP